MKRRAVLLAALAALLAGCGGSSDSNDGGRSLSRRFSFVETVPDGGATGIAADGSPLGMDYDGAGSLRVFLPGSTKTYPLAGYSGVKAVGLTGDFAILEGIQASSTTSGTIVVDVNTGVTAFRAGKVVRGAEGNVVLLADEDPDDLSVSNFARVDLATGASTAIPLPSGLSAYGLAGNFILVERNEEASPALSRRMGRLSARSAKARGKRARVKSRANEGDISLYTVEGVKVLDYQAPAVYSDFDVFSINAKGEAIGVGIDPSGEFGEAPVRWSAGGAATVLETPNGYVVEPQSISDGGLILGVGFADDENVVGDRFVLSEGGRFRLIPTPANEGVFLVVGSPNGKGVIVNRLGPEAGDVIQNETFEGYVFE